jgi:glycosyltransferase involved in cell wall biosynthesis
MKKICIDARLYGIKHTGIGRYVLNLIRYLPKDQKTTVELIVAPENYSDPELKEFRKHVARLHPYNPFSQLEMLFLWMSIRPDLLHVPHFSIPVFWPGKLIVTIHDLIKNYSKGRDTTTKNQFIYKLKYLGYTFVLGQAITRAEKILVPAKYWQEILIRDYHLKDANVVVTYEGVDAGIRPSSDSIKFSIPKPFVVYTGNLYPHKNVPLLLQSIKLLRGKVKLAIVCSRSVFTSRLEKMVKSFNLENDVLFLGKLTDGEIYALYSQAEMFVFPSLIEGFGLPGLEAMSVGLPVVAARASCLPEIYKDAALFFSPTDAKDLKDKITLVLTDQKIKHKLIERGRRIVKNYSWPKMAKETWNEYQKILL